MRNPIRLIVALMLLLSGLYQQLQAQEEVTVQEDTFNFGTIREGEQAPVTFELNNTSSSSVTVKEIRTFASCVQRFPFENRVIEPGQKRKLSLTFESLGFGGVTINKRIEIIHSGSGSPLILTVKGKVMPLEPFQAPLGEVVYNYAVVVDISPAEKFQEAHLMGAVPVPEQELIPWLEENRSSLSEEMIIYICSQDGNASDIAARALHKMGYMQCVSLVGGMKEWHNRYGDKWIISGKRRPRP